jgi:hypothetical protein
MHPSKQSQFPVVQRLRADTDPVYSRPPAAFQFFDIHCSGIRFYGDLRFLSKRKTGPQSIHDPSNLSS